MTVDDLHFVPLVLGHLEEGMARIDACVVDQDIDPPEPRHGIINHAFQHLRVPHVGFEGGGETTLASDGRRRGFGGGPVHIDRVHSSSVAGKQLRHARANSRTRSGHQRHPVLSQLTRRREGMVWF
jgi:hypothetical protein